ncbi:MAG: hypothetical protein HYV96_11030 [Opitutae bacterium]|nr:hypothetical protein [Opitutae bacterium]
MNLDERISAFLHQTETKPARSKLEPYTDLIRTLRQRRWTYVEIAQALRDKFAVDVHPTTIHAFVKVRAKKCAVATMPPPAAPAVAARETKKPRFNLDA